MAIATTQEITQRGLPQGWWWIKLGEVCSIKGGKRLPAGTDFVPGPTPFPYIRVVDFTSGSVRTDNLKYIDKDTQRQIARYIINSDDVYISIAGSIGIAGVIPDELDGAQLTENAARLVIHNKAVICRDYLAIYLQSPDGQEAIKRRTNVVGQPKLALERIATIEIPLPPLPEQRRIAAILTEQLAAVERARAAAAERLATAQALPAAYLRAVFESEEARGWPKTKLGNLLQLRKDVVHPYDNPQGLATFVGLEHVESQTGRRIGGVEIEMAELTGRKPRFYKGDIVYGYLRPYLNKLWLAEFDGLCSVDQYVYSVKPEIANTEFVAWFMRSPVYLDRAPISTTPGQLPRIRTEEVVTVEINLPSLKEQERIAATVTAWMAAAAQARAPIAAQLAAIEALPAALLRQAFSGEL